MPHHHDDPNLTLLDHPIAAHWMGQLRDENTPPGVFRVLVRRLGAMLAWEACRTLDTVEHPVTTPVGPTLARRMDEKVCVVPILRAGLALAEAMLDTVPGSAMGHIGLYRNEQTLEPVYYYDKLPGHAPRSTTLLVDPMLATGGSAAAALKLLRDRGCVKVIFVCMVAAPEGIAALREAEPELPIVTAAIDEGLNDKGYIVPGLGDAGDRAFGTL